MIGRSSYVYVPIGHGAVVPLDHEGFTPASGMFMWARGAAVDFAVVLHKLRVVQHADEAGVRVLLAAGIGARTAGPDLEALPQSWPRVGPAFSRTPNVDAAMSPIPIARSTVYDSFPYVANTSGLTGWKCGLSGDPLRRVANFPVVVRRRQSVPAGSRSSS